MTVLVHMHQEIFWYLSDLTGIEVARFDFSQPQAGKGPCDRSSAHQKFHVNAYLNEGHDVTTAGDIKDALNSHGGVQGVIPFVVECAPCLSHTVPKILGISLLHNFEYTDGGLRVWKAYQVGAGNLLKWNDLDSEGNCQPQLFSVTQEDCCVEKSYKFKVADGEKHASEEQPVAEKSESDISAIFSCPDPGCSREYITLGGLDRHLATGSHDRCRHQNEPLRDSVKRRWVKAFEGTHRVDAPPTKELS